MSLESRIEFMKTAIQSSENHLAQQRAGLEKLEKELVAIQEPAIELDIYVDKHGKFHLELDDSISHVLHTFKAREVKPFVVTPDTVKKLNRYVLKDEKTIANMLNDLGILAVSYD